MNQKNRAVYGILLIVFFFFIVLMLLAAHTLNIFNEEMGSLEKLGKQGKIGVVEIEGVIMSSKTTIELLNAAEEDPQIEAIIVRINSPGGAVGPTQEIYDEIRRIDGNYDPASEDKKKGKPVYASFGAIAASGGYYIGAAARKIFASPGTMTGSIGVIMQFLDLSKLYEFAKVNPEPIKSGRYKDIGQPYRGLTKEEKGLMGDLLDGVHKQFINDIVAQRKSKIKTNIKDLAQGQIFSGEQAFEFGLVDELASLWNAGRQIHKNLGLKGKFGLRFIEKRKKLTFWEIMENFDEAISSFNLKSLVPSTPLLMFKL